MSTEKFSGQFGEFQITRRLGVGGMAETFEALRLGIGGFEQRVCLKRVLPAFSQDAEFVRQFQREARLAATLRHSNIVGVIDFGTEDGTHYMALELVDGIDLRALLAQQPENRLSAEQVALIGIDLAYALDYAHNIEQSTDESGVKSIVHRDVSPANVLISRAGEIKLADFGIAKAMNTAAATASQAIKGKIPYMAPEQMRGEAIDGRADLFSLGVLLFEAAAGVRPFGGTHDVEVMTRILDGDRLSLQKLAPHLPQALCSAIENLLDSDPDQRTPNADALLDELATTAPSPQVRRELARWVESERGGVSTRDHVREVREISADRQLLEAAPDPTFAAHHEEALAEDLSETPWPKRVALVGAVLAMLALIATEISSWGDKPTTDRTDVAKDTSYSNVANDNNNDTVPKTTSTIAPIQTPRQTLNAGKDPKNILPTTVATTTPQPKPKNVESRKSTLRVVVIPRGSVWIDGKHMGEAPINVRLPHGEYEVQAGFTVPSKSRSVVLKPGKRVPLEFDLDE